LLVYKTIANGRAYRPALKVVEGGRAELKFKPA